VSKRAVLTLCLLVAACKSHPAEPEPTSNAQAPVAAHGAEASNAAASAAAPSAPAAPPGACAALCEQTLALKCGKNASDCQAACAPMLTVSPCGAEMNAVLACMVHEPTSHWQCGDDGMAELRDGFCDSAQAAFARCMHPA
jgi:hypothetical protein